MEVVSIERSTYEELLMSFNSFVTKMKEMASKRFVTTERWLFLKSTTRCTISLRTWSVFFMLWLVGTRIVKCVISKRTAYERTDNAS